MRLELLIDSGPFWERLKSDIASARKRVYIQTLSFEADRAGLQLAEAMAASPAVDKRIIIDTYTQYVISDKFLFSPKNLTDRELRQEARETKRIIIELPSRGVLTRFVNPAGFMMSKFARRNHKKIIVIDDTISYIGGINFSDHNFRWHDLMLRIEDSRVADYLSGDFAVSWEGRHFGGECRIGPLQLISLDGANNDAGFAVLFDLIKRAQKKIFVQSPYLSYPFTDHLRDAAKRGVQVTIISPQQNNKPMLQQCITWESRRSGFDLRLLPDRMTHLKAMLIDDSHLVLGSSNFDFFSYRFEQETMAITTDAALILDFITRIVEPDLARSIPAPLDKNGWKGYLSDFRLRAVARLCTLFG